MTSKVIDLFNNYVKRFDRHQGADAREFKSDQKIVWETLGNIARTELSRSMNDSSSASEVSSLTSAIVESIDRLVTVEQDIDESFVVRGIVPLIDRHQNLESIIKSDFNLFLGAFTSEISINLGASSEILAQTNKMRIISQAPYRMHATKYMAIKYASIAHLEKKFSSFERTANNLFRELEEASHKYSSSIQGGQIAQSTTLEKFEEQKQNLFQEIKEDASSQIEARLNAQEELDKIRYPVKIWTSAARRHKRNFLIGLICVYLAVAFFSVGSLAYFQSFIERIGLAKTDSSQAFTPASTVALATIIAILAAAGYALKILGRFVTNALTLAEDAEVRASLADTFIGLTAQDTNLSKEARDQARTVMLAALFRPLPGHQQEDLTAPTVLSLAQDLLKKPSGS